MTDSQDFDADPIRVEAETFDLPGAWRGVALIHQYRDPRCLGRERDAIAYARALPRPYACPRCRMSAPVLIVGIVDSPDKRTLAARCPACHHAKPDGLFSDLVLCARRDRLTPEFVKATQEFIVKQERDNRVVMADDAAWFERNPARTVRCRLPLSAAEVLASGRSPVPGAMLPLKLIGRDAHAHRHPTTLWCEPGALPTDEADTPQAVASAVDALLVVARDVAEEQGFVASIEDLLARVADAKGVRDALTALHKRGGAQ